MYQYNCRCVHMKNTYLHADDERKEGRKEGVCMYTWTY